MEPIELTAAPLREENFSSSANDNETMQRLGKPGKGVTIHVGMRLDEAEREIILASLHEYGGNKRRTAEVLGISLKTLYNRLAAYQNNGEPAAFAPDPTPVRSLATKGVAPLCSQDPTENPTEHRDR